jgi:hypothetical protein
MPLTALPPGQYPLVGGIGERKTFSLPAFQQVDPPGTSRRVA